MTITVVILKNSWIIVVLCCQLNWTLNVEQQFANYVNKFNKSYTNDSLEYWNRLKNFQNSLKRISQFNKINPQGLYGLTKYSDMSPEEFKKSVLRPTTRLKRSIENNSVNLENTFKKDNLKKLPEKVDWRESGAVTGVKNQKSCGACWAFSAVETMESMKKLETGILEELSVQQVIDCARGGNYGCSGGDTCTVLGWMNSTKFQLTSEKDYPLTDTFGTCKQINSSTKVEIQGNFTCENYLQDEIEMVKLLANHGPIIAAVDATTWQDYLGGIIQYHCDVNTNHAVEIVGYDARGEIPFYIVRNSWGPEFGLSGYLHIAIGNNLCGIAERVSALSIINI